MKIIILLAICLTAALAVPAPKPSVKLHPLMAFAEKLQPTLEILKDRKLRLELLEDPPGLKEVWEQLNDSLYAIADLVWAVPSHVVPMIEKTNTGSALEKRLPKIAELGAQGAYNVTRSWVEFWIMYNEEFIGVPYPPQYSVVDFITAGLVTPIFEVPYVAIKETGKLIRQRNATIGEEYDSFIQSSVDSGMDELMKFSNVLWEGLDPSKK